MQHFRLKMKNIYAIVALSIIYVCLCLLNKVNYQINDANSLLKLTFTAIKFSPSGLDLLSPTFNMTPLLVATYFYMDYFTEDFEKAYVYVFTRFIDKRKWIFLKIIKLAILVFLQELIIINVLGIFTILVTGNFIIGDFIVEMLRIFISRYFTYFAITLLSSFFALLLGEVLGYMLFLLKLLLDQFMSLLLLVFNNKVLNYLHNFIPTSQNNYLWYSDSTSELNIQYDFLNIPQMSIFINLIYFCILTVGIYFILSKYLKGKDLFDVVKTNK